MPWSQKMAILPALLLVAAAVHTLPPGDHVRIVPHEGRDRSYRLHVPPGLPSDSPVPLLLALHPFATSAQTMQRLSRLDDTADREGFLVAYPEGTGPVLLRNWNEGSPGKTVDDVGFISAVLDDLAAIARIDPSRVYATGLSNGAMMCYRLASELSGRIAAIAPVAGTMSRPEIAADRAVSVLHIHGTADRLVPYDGPDPRAPKFLVFLGVQASVEAWARHDGCPPTPLDMRLPDADGDGHDVLLRTYGPGREGSEILLYRVEDGGHVWPGSPLNAQFLGRNSRDFQTNALIWAFFERHPRTTAGPPPADGPPR